MEENLIDEKTDNELVQSSLKNQDDYVFIIKKYEKKLEKYIKRLGNLSNEDIEDLLQDIFIKVYKNLNNFDDNLKFSSWIYRIAHNETINKFKKSKFISNNTDDLDLFIDKLLDCVDCEHNKIEDDFDKNILKEKVEKIFNKMSFKYKEILILKFIEEKDYKEISDIIKKPMGTVGTLINRAKKQFKQIYEHK